LIGGAQSAGVDRAFALFPYAGKYRRLLAAYKFGKNLALGNFLAEKMLERIRLMRLFGLAAFPGGAFAGGASVGALSAGPFPAGAGPEAGLLAGLRAVPVPPRPGRVRKAGWDPIGRLARLLERGAGAEPGAPVCRCLRRLPSESQKALGRDGRRANLRGRIEPTRRAPEAALLIDDVATTGSTLEACAAALREGGAKAVFGLCLFQGSR